MQRIRGRHTAFLITIVWAVFVLFVRNRWHLRIYDIRDFHGAHMGETYLVCSGKSAFLFLLTVIITGISVIKIFRSEAWYWYLFSIMAGVGWIMYYQEVCKTVPYFF